MFQIFPYCIEADLHLKNCNCKRDRTPHCLAWSYSLFPSATFVWRRSGKRLRCTWSGTDSSLGEHLSICHGIMLCTALVRDCRLVMTGCASDKAIGGEKTPESGYTRVLSLL